jgi:hypothetical protein
MEISDTLTASEAAAYLRLKPATLANWRCKGIGPAYMCYSNRAIRYSRAALDAFKAAAVRSPLSADAA